LSRWLVIVGCAGALATASYAVTAANTVPATSAGSGASTISGYVVSNVQYSLNASAPANVDAVTFTLDAAATTGKAKLVSSTTSYYACTNTSGLNWSCATTSPQATVAASNELSVLAVA
jgi:hypothetical protein